MSSFYVQIPTVEGGSPLMTKRCVECPFTEAEKSLREGCGSVDIDTGYTDGREFRCHMFPGRQCKGFQDHQPIPRIKVHPLKMMVTLEGSRTSTRPDSLVQEVLGTR